MNVWKYEIYFECWSGYQDVESGFYLGFFVWGRSQLECPNEWPKARSILGGGAHFGEMDTCWDAIWCIKIFMILRHNGEWPKWSQLFWGGSWTVFGGPANPRRYLNPASEISCSTREILSYFQAFVYCSVNYIKK